MSQQEGFDFAIKLIARDAELEFAVTQILKGVGVQFISRKAYGYWAD